MNSMAVRLVPNLAMFLNLKLNIWQYLIAHTGMI
jgi:hypothetical protein